MKRSTPLKRSAFKSPRKPMARGSKRLTARKRLSKRSKKKISKDKVWKQFSIFIRTRGADSQGFNVCVTCGIRKFWRELQAGHFIAGRSNAILFSERSVFPQCYSCNVGKHGHTVLYYKWMLAQFGQEVIDELILESNQTVKWPKGHLDELFQRYSALNAENPLVSAESDS